MIIHSSQKFQNAWSLAAMAPIGLLEAMFYHCCEQS
jgi:hypothetical protein